MFVPEHVIRLYWVHTIRNELPTSIQRIHKYGKDPKTQQEAPHHRFQMESYKLGQQQKLEEDPILERYSPQTNYFYQLHRITTHTLVINVNFSFNGRRRFSKVNKEFHPRGFTKRKNSEILDYLSSSRILMGEIIKFTILKGQI